jgi:hypothetical protein
MSILFKWLAKKEWYLPIAPSGDHSTKYCPFCFSQIFLKPVHRVKTFKNSIHHIVDCDKCEVPVIYHTVYNHKQQAIPQERQI